MSNGNHVRPGEVISSSLINQMLDRLDALEQAGGGQGQTPTGPIVIDGFSPATEQEVGNVLTILGSNLPFPPTGNSVTVGNVPVPAANLRLAPSNRERLEFVVPDIGAIPAAGSNVFIRVYDGFNSAQRLYRILPSSGGPATPTITAIRPVGGSAGDLVPMGSVAVIEGTNFSANAANNTVTFTPMGFIPAADPYPRPADGPLNVTSTATDEIRVEVPDMAEITVPLGARRVAVEVSVNGAADPASFEFFTFRT